MDRMLPILVTLVALGAGVPGNAQALKSGVSDHAGLFSTETVARADRTLHDMERKTHWQARIETVESVVGQTVKDRAVANANRVNAHGLYILISKNDHQVRVEHSDSAKGAFPQSDTRGIVSILVKAFKAKEFDQGLLDAIDLIAEDATKTPSHAPASARTTTEPAIEPSPRDQERSLPPAEVPAAPPADVVPKPEMKSTPGLMSLLLVGGGVLLVIWMVGRVFRHASTGAAVPPGGPQSYPPPGTPVNPQQVPGSGLGPQQVPGYGPGQRPYVQGGPPPNYGPASYPSGPGYAAPPQQAPGGGGFVSGALGGMGGAVLGNILYDKFGRPHPGQDVPQGAPGAFPQEHAQHAPSNEGAAWTPGPPPIQDEPRETYDPNSGVGGDWGAPQPDPVDAPAGQDWSGGEPEAAADAGAGGDWGGGEAPAEDAGGDGGGGDWGDAGAGGNDENQGTW